jgi:nucleoside-diphosphate-sugar epimerase
MHSPKFLVTGATGFVGRAVVDELSASGEVLGVARSAPAGVGSNCKLVLADLAQGLPQKFECPGVTVVHAAGARESDSRDELWADNVEATRYMLEWAVRQRARHFIYVSTGKVYGYSYGRRDAHVETDPVRPLGLYAHTKRIGEQLVEAYHAAAGLSSTIVRLFFPYGPGQQHGLLHHIENSIQHGLALAINNNGAPRMNPIHVEDVATAIAALVEPREGVQIYNVCGDEVLSFLGLVQAAESRLGLRANRQETGLDCGDLLGSNARLKRNFDWSPRRRLLKPAAPALRPSFGFEPVLDAILVSGHP